MGCRSETPATPKPILPPHPSSSVARTNRWQTLTRHANEHDLPSDAVILRVSVYHQRMDVVQAGRLLKQYAISTSKAGIGNRQDSHRTPLGWHRVKERYGADAAPGQHFAARRPAGRPLPPSEWRAENSADRVLSRILRLDGLEPGLNYGPGIDSFERCIYIHGTNQEQLLGRPASHGCIRMANRDVIELFTLADGMAVGCLIAEE